MDDMLETMYDAPGVGLAAPQVGISQRLFVYDDGETGPRFMANPELSAPDGEVVEDEGCLSIPGRSIRRRRRRPSRVAARTSTAPGTRWRAGACSRAIFQHETDHLSGTLFIDHLDDEGRRAVMAELRRIELGLEEPRSKRRFLRKGGAERADA